MRFIETKLARIVEYNVVATSGDYLNGAPLSLLDLALCENIKRAAIATVTFLLFKLLHNVSDQYILLININ